VIKSFLTIALAAAAFAGATSLRAADFSSGLAVGDAVPTYTSEKCAGTEDDGIKEGQKLCYT
jgi:hypothetical protein